MKEGERQRAHFLTGLLPLILIGCWAKKLKTTDTTVSPDPVEIVGEICRAPEDQNMRFPLSEQSTNNL